MPDPPQDVPGSPSASPHSLFSCCSCLESHPVNGSWVASPQASLETVSGGGDGDVAGHPSSWAETLSPLQSSKNWGPKVEEASSCDACVSHVSGGLPGALVVWGTKELHWMRDTHSGCPSLTKAWKTR